MKPVTLPITRSEVSRRRRAMISPLSAGVGLAMVADRVQDPPASRRLFLPARGRLVYLEFRRVLLAQGPPVFVRKYLGEPAARRLPMIEDRQRQRAAGEPQVPFDQRAQERFVGLSRVQHPPLARRRQFLFGAKLVGLRQHVLQRHHRGVAALREGAVLIVHVGGAAAYPGGEVSPGAPA